MEYRLLWINIWQQIVLLWMLTKPNGLTQFQEECDTCNNNDVIQWKHFPRHRSFMREIHQSPVNYPHKGQWRGALMFSLVCAWINGRLNNREVGDSRRQRSHYDVIVMNVQLISLPIWSWLITVLNITLLYRKIVWTSYKYPMYRQ